MKFFCIGILMLILSGCNNNPYKESNIASLYTGYEGGSWYKFSPSTCSAKLCPAY